MIRAATPAGLTRRAGALVPVLAWGTDLAFIHRDAGFGVIGLAASAAVFATLYARNRYPVAVLAVQLLWLAVAGLWLGVYPVVGSLVALYAIAARRPPGISVSALALTATVILVQLGLPASFLAAVENVVMACLVTAAAWGLGYRSYTSSAASASAAADALRAERLRLARELHDIISHAISAIVFQAAGARAVLADDPARADRALQAIEGSSAHAMDELHRLLGLLRSAGGDTTPALSRQPGLRDIGELLDWARTNELIPETTVEGEPSDLDDFTSLTAYRLVQEALTNTLKHAGPGTPVELLLRWSDEHLEIRVTDRRTGHRERGRGRPGGGHGLLGLRERVTIAGGTLQAYPGDDGFVVHARLPLTRHREQAFSSTATELRTGPVA